MTEDVKELQSSLDPLSDKTETDTAESTDPSDSTDPTIMPEASDTMDPSDTSDTADGSGLHVILANDFKEYLVK